MGIKKFLSSVCLFFFVFSLLLPLNVYGNPKDWAAYHVFGTVIEYLKNNGIYSDEYRILDPNGEFLKSIDEYLFYSGRRCFLDCESYFSEIYKNGLRKFLDDQNNFRMDKGIARQICRFCIGLDKAMKSHMELLERWQKIGRVFEAYRGSKVFMVTRRERLFFADKSVLYKMLELNSTFSLAIQALFSSIGFENLNIISRNDCQVSVSNGCQCCSQVNKVPRDGNRGNLSLWENDIYNILTGRKIGL